MPGGMALYVSLSGTLIWPNLNVVWKNKIKLQLCSQVTFDPNFCYLDRIIAMCQGENAFRHMALIVVFPAITRQVSMFSLCCIYEAKSRKVLLSWIKISLCRYVAGLQKTSPHLFYTVQSLIYNSSNYIILNKQKKKKYFTIPSWAQKWGS